MIDYIKLGATLFIPAVHKNLDAVLHEKKYKNLKSVVLDTEDSIDADNVENALRCLENSLNHFLKTELLVFIRPRNLEVLKRILKFKNIEKIDGFILPKFSLKNAKEYLFLLKDTNYSIMPSIEGSELFETSKLRKLCDILLPQKEKIILIRFGLEDMLKQLRVTRSSEDSIFDLSACSVVLGNLLAIFKSVGFEVSGGVYPYFNDDTGFKKDVLRDLKEGLFSKTIVHPSQIEITNELYKVTQKEYDEARYIEESKTVLNTYNKKMIEKNTMSAYAEHILKRAKYYGISN